MSKRCIYCEVKNPDDFCVCKNCGKILNQDGIKVGKSVIFFVFLFVFLILFYIGAKIYDKMQYKEVSLPDKKYNMNVVQFKMPKKWVPVGRVFYNPKSIPNLLTFFVAAVNPKEVVEFQFFSTQFETDDGKEFQSTGKYKPVSPEGYFAKIIKKLSPNATNIKLEKVIVASKKELDKAKLDGKNFNKIYEDINPGTTKGRSWIDNYVNIPIKYIYSYEEKGKKYKHLLEGRFVSFVQCFSNKLEKTAKTHTAIKFIKCEDVFSYKAESTLFEKNKSKYKVFNKNVKINPQWIEYANSERRQILSDVEYITTESIVGGDKFKLNEFKNTIYVIEYLDYFSVSEITK